MTKFDTDLAMRGWALISEGAAMISLAYAANESGVAGSVPPAAPAETFPDLPPILDEYGNEVAATAPTSGPVALKPQVDAGLGKCPIHGKPWSIKQAGVGRNGKPYEAFFKCSEKDGDTWCTQKPQKIWRDTHPIREVAA